MDASGEHGRRPLLKASNSPYKASSYAGPQGSGASQNGTGPSVKEGTQLARQVHMRAMIAEKMKKGRPGLHAKQIGPQPKLFGSAQHYAPGVTLPLLHGTVSRAVGKAHISKRADLLQVLYQHDEFASVFAPNMDTVVAKHVIDVAMSCTTEPMHTRLLDECAMRVKADTASDSPLPPLVPLTAPISVGYITAESRLPDCVDVHVTVKATSQLRQKGHRASLMCLVHMSSSMAGEHLLNTKDNLHRIINTMTADDYLGIVSYSSKTTVLLHITRMTESAKLWAHVAVELLPLGAGYAALSDGVGECLRQQREVTDPDTVKSLFIITAGPAVGSAQGVADVIKTLQTPEHEPGVIIHTVALGHQGSAAMQSIASASSGCNFNVRDGTHYRLVCLRGLHGPLFHVASDVTLGVYGGDGYLVGAEIVGTGKRVEGGVCFAGEMWSGTDKDLRLTFQLPGNHPAALDPSWVADLKVTYTDVTTGSKVELVVPLMTKSSTAEGALDVICILQSELADDKR